MVEPTIGYIDSCQQVHITGWAVKDGRPAELLRIEVDGEIVGSCRCDQPRPDVVAAGYPEHCGFVYRFPRAVGASDRTISVRFADGTGLANSPSQHHSDRVSRLSAGIDATLPGLEFGALDSPFLTRPAYTVLYVDHAPRESIIEKYQADGPDAFDRAQVVETDIVWTPGSRLHEAVGGRKFAYAIASHVIEHVADPVGWLAEIASVLRPGARINLSIPEKTRTFDRLRALSTPADLLDAYRRGLTRPSFRQVFDQLTGTQANPGPEVYRSAYAIAATAAERYINVHCHTWTYQSFLDCWRVLDTLGLLTLKLVAAFEPISGSNEFIVSFVKRSQF